MTPERWQQVKEVLNAALGRDPHARAAFISKACGGDESLRHEVESLIISHGEAGSFIEEPAFNVNAELFADEQTERFLHSDESITQVFMTPCDSSVLKAPTE